MSEKNTQKVECAACGTSVAEGFKFCPDCGSRITDTGKEKETPAPAQAAMDPVGDDSQTTRIISPGKDDPSKSAGLVENRYELIEPVGSGGFSVVFKAMDRKLNNRIVAVKLIYKQKNDMEQSTSLSRFMKELSAIAMLKHRNIVTVFDCSSDEKNHYIIMEFIEGGTLKEYLLKKGRLEVEEAISLVKGICQGLLCAHRNNLIHRDIKPSNIMLSFEGDEVTPKIVDFGIVRHADATDPSLTTGVGIGTPLYVSPEQRRDAKNVNHTTDIYSVGKLLFELVTGEPPEAVAPDLLKDYGALSDIILKCVRTRPEERYFSAEDLISDLENYLNGSIMPADTGVPEQKKQYAEGTVACPICSYQNNTESKFCAKCGNGLTISCPECGNDISSQTKFCDDCGTDIPAFYKVKEIMDVMVSAFEDSKWSNILKAAEDIPDSGKLAGDKGMEFLERIKSMVEKAKKNYSEDRSFTEALKTARLFEENGEFRNAVTVLERYLNEYPMGGHFSEVRQRITVLKKKSYKGPLLGTSWNCPGLFMNLVPVKKGEFLAGSPSGGLFGFGGEKGRRSNEVQKPVKIDKDFWIAEHPVTINDYLHFMSSHDKDPLINWASSDCPMEKAGRGSKTPGGCFESKEQPIVEISWFAATAFCKWLNQREEKEDRLPDGYVYRLPAEEEWEYCCRAGSQDRFCFGDDERYLHEFAWYMLNSDGRTHPVGLKKPNEWGIFDMHGNVWEWCAGKLDSDSGSSSKRSLSLSGRLYARRGGSWINDANHCRSAYRNAWEASSYFPYLGFRVVLSPKSFINPENWG